MAKECSEDSPYKSRFGGGFLSKGQWLAENMMARMARRDKTELPHKFWNQPRWKRQFLNQLRLANSLLKLYDVEAIVRALNRREGKNIYSFSAPWLNDLIKNEQEKYVKEIESLKEVAANRESEVLPEEEPVRPCFVQKPSLLDKLRQLDG